MQNDEMLDVEMLDVEIRPLCFSVVKNKGLFFAPLGRFVLAAPKTKARDLTHF